MRARGVAVGAAVLALTLPACANDRPTVADPISWTMQEGICRRIPLARLTGTAGWGALETRDVSESFVAGVDLDQTSCSLFGALGPSRSGVLLDRGQLIVKAMSAVRAEGLDDVVDTFRDRGVVEESFSVRGPYGREEERIDGWWSAGTLRRYTQDAGGATAAATRVVVTARVIDANVTASATALAHVRTGSPAPVERLTNLVVDTLLALEGALSR